MMMRRGKILIALHYSLSIDIIHLLNYCNFVMMMQFLFLAGKKFYYSIRQFYKKPLNILKISSSLTHSLHQQKWECFMAILKVLLCQFKTIPTFILSSLLASIQTTIILPSIERTERSERSVCIHSSHCNVRKNIKVL